MHTKIKTTTTKHLIKHLPSKSLSQPQGDFLLSNPGLHQLFLFVPLIDNWDVESLKVEGGPTQGRQCACTGVALGLIWQVTAQRDLTRTAGPELGSLGDDGWRCTDFLKATCLWREVPICSSFVLLLLWALTSYSLLFVTFLLSSPRLSFPT